MKWIAFLIAFASTWQAAQASDWVRELRRAEDEMPALRSKAASDQEAARVLASKLQRLGNYRMFLGDSVGALDALEESLELLRFPILQRPGDQAQLAAARAEDAIPAIAAAARNRRIVIINESHHAPMHRAFAMQLARELKKLGFTYLACETFEDAQPMSKGYLARDAGYYSQDPVFANFLRDAAKDGWKMVQYEPFDERPREQGEASNLFDRTFARDPDAKVFVLVGYGHLRKKPTADEDPRQAMMAAHLAKLSGHDPLVIDQASVMATTRKGLEHPMYTAAQSRFPGTASFVLRSAQGGYAVFGTKYEGSVDMQVFHRPSQIDPASGRPQWLQTVAGYSAVEVPPQLLPEQGSRYVYAAPKGQPADVVPADIVLLHSGHPAPKFMLPPGEYTYGILK